MIVQLVAMSSALANVVGSDAQNFNPTTSGLDFVTVQSSETLAPGIFNLGLFVNHGQNSFPYYGTLDSSGNATSQKDNRDNSLLGGDFNFGFGLGPNWDAGVSFPFILNQQVADTQTVGSYSNTGNTEVRINTKYRLFGSDDGGVAIVASGNFNRIKNNPFLGEGGGPIFNFELAGDMTISQVAAALNLGYRFRNPGEPILASGLEPIPNQWLASGALSYLFEPIDTKLIFEVLAAVPESKKLKGATDREYTVMEALMGVKYDQSSSLSLQLGVGTGLMNGVSSPDFRAYAGLNFAIGPIFGKRKPLQSDPYSSPRRVARRRAMARPLPVDIDDTTSATPKAKAQAQVSVPTESLEPGPSVGVEKVRDVPVYNRGSFNHIVLNSIEFKGNTLELKPESRRYLTQELAPTINELNRRRPIATIVVEGHTDSLGTAAQKQKLSEQRAKIVADILRKNNDLSIPIQVIGLGDTSPIADNGNYQGRAMNRRVEFKLLYKRSSR